MEWEASYYEWMDRGTGITKLVGTSWNSANMLQNSFRWESAQEKSKVFNNVHVYKRKVVHSEHSDNTTDSH
jgi:hypothetical protein